MIDIKSAGLNVILGLGNIDFVPNPRSKAAMIFRVDDCYASAYNVLYPMLAAVGHGAYLQPGDVLSTSGINQPGRVTSSQISQMAAAGWQLGSSCATTEDVNVIDSMSPGQRINEFNLGRSYGEWFNKYRDTYDGAYFSDVNFTDMIAFPQLAATHRTLQTFLNGNALNPPLPEGETFPFSDRFAIKVLNMAQNGGGGGASTTTYAQYAIAQAVANKGVIIFACHDDFSNSNITTAFQDAVNYAVANPSLIEITTIRKLLAPYCADPLYG